jgi:hypothetical protein
MPAINDWWSRWSALSGATLIVLGTIWADDFDSGMLPEPVSKAFCAAIFQPLDWLMGLSSDENRPIRVPWAKSKIVHAKDSGSWERRGLLFGAPKPAVSPHRHGSLRGQSGASLPT